MAPIAIAALLILISLFNYLFFHTAAELFAIIVAAAMFLISRSTFSFSRDSFLMFLASGYFWIGVLDLLHTLNYPGMNVFETGGTNTAVQYWIVARYFEAIILLIAPLFFVRKVNPGLLFSGFGAATLLVYAFIVEGMAPVLFVEGVGLSPLKIYSEYVIVGILGVALFHLFRTRTYLSRNIFFALAGSIILTMGAELAFTFYVSAFGLSNLVGHIFKFTSYWIILGVIIRATLIGPYLDLRNENRNRKKAQEELDRFFMLTFDMQCIAGFDGYFTRINRAWESTLGYSADELKSRPFIEFVHEEDQAGTIEAAGKLADGRGVVEFENRYRKKDGTYIWMLWNATSDIEHSLIYATARDITQRKHYEQILEKTVEERTRDLVAGEERLRLILDNVVDSIITTDDNGTIVSCNPGTEKIFGFTDSEMIGRNIDMLMPEYEAKEHGAHMGAYLKTGTPKIIGIGRELEGRRKNSDIFPIDLAISQLEIDGKKLFIGIVRDITDRKIAEKRLQLAKESADNANQAKSEFLSSMSHELRTPMNAILGFGQMLDFNPKEPLTKTQKSSVDQILKGGQHLLELINDILDLARIEAGKVDVSIEDISPTKILDECISLTTDMAERRGIVITIPEATAAIPKVRADHTRFKQVLLNLMSNAVKYNRENGTITIAMAEAAGDKLRISVTDTGKGLSEDQQKELFKPFSRLGAENSEIEGTGIGLVVCRNLIQLMNGAIGLASEVGKGSTFWIELPLAEESHDEANAIEDVPVERTESSLPGASGTILYIEDNPSNLTLMEEIVSRIENLHMLSAHTAELGIGIARSKKPDLIILDINLPGMNGIEALKKLQQFDETKNIPVLALSAAATKSDIAKGIEAGFLQYLTKPINVMQVIDAIKNAIDSVKVSV